MSYSFWPQIPRKLTLQQSWENLVRKTLARLYAITRTEYSIQAAENPTKMSDVICISTRISKEIHYYSFEVTAQELLNSGDFMGCYVYKFEEAVEAIRQYFKGLSNEFD